MLFKKRTDADGITDSWRLYEKGISYLEQFDFFSNTDTAYRFYDGNQWEGIKAPKNASLPVLNVIKAILLYKIALVAQKGFAINYSAANFDDEDLQLATSEICGMLNDDAARCWENLNMDAKLWDVFSDGAKTGESYLYFSPKISKTTQRDLFGKEITLGRLDGLELKQIDGTNILFGDENTPDIQEQPYILLPYRDFVYRIRDEARANGLDESEIDRIIPDSNCGHEAGESGKHELDNGGSLGKALCLIKFWKKDGVVWFSKSTRLVEFQPASNTKMKLYPVAGFWWANKKGSARGIGEVLPLVPNQIEINKNLARMSNALRWSSTAKVVYDKRAFPDISKLLEGQSAVGFENDDVRRINEIIGFLQPPPMKTEAKLYIDDLLTQTRELAGAGDIAMGNINPERASGAAIVAVRDASAIPLNGQMARAKKFIEDIARIWIDMKIANSPGGVEVLVEKEAGGENRKIIVAQKIPSEIMERLKLSIRVDVSPADPYSLYAVEQKLDNLRQAGILEPVDYIELLPDTSNVPKGRIIEILNKKTENSVQNGNVVSAFGNLPQNIVNTPQSE